MCQINAYKLMKLIPTCSTLTYITKVTPLPMLIYTTELLKEATSN